MNTVNIIGRLSTQVYHTDKNGKGGSAFFVVAVSRRNKDDGADFIPCRAFNGQAATTAKYVGKGDEVAITGRIHIERDENGVDKVEIWANEVSFLRKKGAGSPASTSTEPVRDEDEPLPAAPPADLDLAGFCDESDIPF